MKKNKLYNRRLKRKHVHELSNGGGSLGSLVYSNMCKEPDLDSLHEFQERTHVGCKEEKRLSAKCNGHFSEGI